MELEEFTKAEIITWVKGNLYKQPKKSQLMLIRWQIQSAKLDKRDNANMAALRKIDAKKHDEYAKRCNASEDLSVKMTLLKKIKVIGKQFDAYFTESKKIDIEYKRVQKIYDQIDIERQKEQIEDRHRGVR